MHHGVTVVICVYLFVAMLAGSRYVFVWHSFKRFVPKFWWHLLINRPLPSSLLDKLLMNQQDSDGFFSRRLVCIDYALDLAFLLVCIGMKSADMVWHMWYCCDSLSIMSWTTCILLNCSVTLPEWFMNTTYNCMCHYICIIIYYYMLHQNNLCNTT